MTKPTVEIADIWVAAPEIMQESHAFNGSHEELEELTEQFKARGGVIQVIPFGVLAQPEVDFNNRCSLSGNSAYSTEEVLSHRRRRAVKAMGDDSYAVAKLGTLLGTGLKRKDLISEMGCSDDKIQRLLADYFADDERADPYRKGADPMRTRKDPNEGYDEYRQLRGSMSHEDTCTQLHIGYRRGRHMRDRYEREHEAERVEKIRAGLAEGKPLQAIAFEMHTSTRIVKNLILAHTLGQV